MFRDRSRHFLFILAAFLLLALTGCREVDRFYGYLQHAGPKLNVRAGRMTITMGDGRYDIRKAVASQKYEGEVKKDRVTVAYIDGTRVQAEKVAEAFDKMYDLVNERLGLGWAFDVTIRFVNSSDVPDSGWFYSEKLRADGKIAFPLVVDLKEEKVSLIAAAVIAHELTEASLLRPEHKRDMLLGDAWIGDSTLISYHTRWFRDGVSDYAANLFVTEVLGERPVILPDFYRLSQVREKILKWENPGQPENYAVAHALIHEIVFRCGEDSLPAIMQEVKKTKATGGSELRSAVQKATGMDLRGFLSEYETPWLGFSVRRPRSDQVLVDRIWKGTPATRWRLQRGDRILEMAGEKIETATQFQLLLARQKVGDRVKVVVERKGNTCIYNMKTIPYFSEPLRSRNSKSYRPGSVED